MNIIRVILRIYHDLIVFLLARLVEVVISHRTDTWLDDKVFAHDLDVCVFILRMLLECVHLSLNSRIHW